MSAAGTGWALALLGWVLVIAGLATKNVLVLWVGMLPSLATVVVWWLWARRRGEQR